MLNAAVISLRSFLDGCFYHVLKKPIRQESGTSYPDYGPILFAAYFVRSEYYFSEASIVYQKILNLQFPLNWKEQEVFDLLSDIVIGETAPPCPMSI